MSKIHSLNWLLGMLLIAASTSVYSPVEISAEEKGEGSPLPVTRVVLFNSGVGFFQHAGNVEGNDHIEMKFKVEDINDLLKSMVLQDMNGGKISTVSFG